MEAFGKTVEKRQRLAAKHVQYPPGFESVRGARLLLVEDNEVNRQVATELLEQEGFWLDSANDGLAAVELVRQSAADTFDLVLMDLQMPEMDGYTATREIRGLGYGLPIVAMTADAMSGVAERCQEAGMNDYVAKPIVPQELFATLLRWIPPGSRPLNQAKPKATDTGPALPSLPGIDTAEGLARMGGNRTAYRKLLLKFAQNNAGIGTEIRNALQQGNAELALRLAHTLKGVSGNIGAAMLHEAAKELEAAIKEQHPELTLLLENCERELDQVLQSIAMLESAEEDGAQEETAEVNVDELTPLVTRLKELLQEDDMEAVEVLAEIQSKAKGTQLSHPLQAVEAALGQYDFQQALDLVERLTL
jgi:CheY-like chemotaxis protein